MARTAAISVRVEPALKEALEAAAKKDDRTLAQYVERVLIAHLRSEGLLRAAGQK
jgi:predicted HicB family RNase H-like nuclease